MGLRNPAAAAPHVALIVDSTFGYGRAIVAGIAQYVREHGPWSLYFEPRNLANEIPIWLHRWKGNGIIARLQTSALAEALVRTKVPVVDTVGDFSPKGVAAVHCDDAAIGRMAADHFLQRAFRSFACCTYRFDADDHLVQDMKKHGHDSSPPDGRVWSRQRCEAMIARVEKLGYPCSVHSLPSRTATGSAWEREQNLLSNWIGRLPKPTGIFATNDNLGRRVLEACRRIDMAVPDQIAVVGVDNDEVLCQVCDPPLSSVVADHHRVGYEAARLLDELMQGNPVPESSLKIAPRGVVARVSSDVLALEDADVSLAVREIREHACEGIDVGEVARRVGLSRTTLKRRFRAALNRSVQEEIAAVQLKRVQQLLAETELPLKAIARQTGFRHASSLAAAFKLLTGMTPGEYRLQAHGS